MNFNLEQFLKEAQKTSIENKEELQEETCNSIQEVIDKQIISENMYTISLSYSEEEQEATLNVDARTPILIKEKMDSESYLEICKNMDINTEEEFNSSSSRMYKGVRVRAFAVTKPISKYPVVTISTTKTPPVIWGQTELTDLLKTIARTNFIVVGGSGDGKTYLTNFLINEGFKNTNIKVGLIDEFGELCEPNDNTTRLLVPPTKPNSPSLLKYIIEQTNLQRFKSIFVGEIKGEEGWPFILNLSSGTRGGATLHADSCILGIQRLQNLSILANVPEQVVKDTITKGIKVVIHVENHQIEEIRMLTGTANQFIYTTEVIWDKINGYNPRFSMEKFKEFLDIS